MAPPIQLTGGTGTLGGHVVRPLRETGRAVGVLGRHSHKSEDGIGYVTGDLATGEGIEAAVDRAGTIVRCASSANGEEDKTSNLPRAEHMVYIPVVGADRILTLNRVERAMFGCFESKLAPERDVGHRSWEQFLAGRVRRPARQAGDAVGTAVSANVGSSATTPRQERRKPPGLPTGLIRRSRR